MNDAHERVLQAMRQAVRDSRKVATCLEGRQARGDFQVLVD